MTDKMKMPEVGNKYLFRDEYKFLGYVDTNEVELLAIYTAGDEYWYHCREVKWILRTYVGKVKDFWKHFEEIEDQPSVKENLMDDKLRVALEELKELSKFILEMSEKYRFDEIYSEARRVKYLINILDSNIPQKADCGEFSGESPWIARERDIKQREESKIKEVVKQFLGRNQEEKPKSIWKPIEELPEERNHVIILDCLNRYSLFECAEGGLFHLSTGREVSKDVVKKFTKLTDFINHIESLEQRIKKLEEK